MLIGIYFDGQGGSDAALALAAAARGAGHHARLRDLRSWRDDCVERFERVVIIPGAADPSAVRVAYDGHAHELSTVEAFSEAVLGIRPPEPEPPVEVEPTHAPNHKRKKA